MAITALPVFMPACEFIIIITITNNNDNDNNINNTFSCNILNCLLCINKPKITENIVPF